MPDDAVLSGGIHSLEDNQQRVAIGRIVKLLHCAELFNVPFQKLLVLRPRLVYRIDKRGPLPEIDLIAFWHAKVTGIDFHIECLALGAA